MHLLTNKRQRETLGRMMPCSSTLLRPPRCLLVLVIEIFVASLTSSIFIFQSHQICCNISCLVHASYLCQHALPYCSSLTSAYHLIYTCLGLFLPFIEVPFVCVRHQELHVRMVQVPARGRTTLNRKLKWQQHACGKKGFKLIISDHEQMQRTE